MVQLGPDTTSDAAGGTPSAAASGYAGRRDPAARLLPHPPLGSGGARCSATRPPAAGHRCRCRPPPAAATVGLVRQAAGPGWYRGTLGNGVMASLAAADRTAPRESFTLPRRSAAPGCWSRRPPASRRVARGPASSFPSRREVAVDATSGGFCGSAGTLPGPRAATASTGPCPDAAPGVPRRANGSVAGPDVGAWVAFGTGGGTERARRSGVSFVDAAGGGRNLASGGPGWSYRALRRRRDRRLVARGGPGCGQRRQHHRAGAARHRALRRAARADDAQRRRRPLPGLRRCRAPGRDWLPAVHRDRRLGRLPHDAAAAGRAAPGRRRSDVVGRCSATPPRAGGCPAGRWSRRTPG